MPPGIDRQSTQQSNQGVWYDCNNIRWQDQDTQTIGGWVNEDGYILEGQGRALHAWTDFNGNQYQVVGTSNKYYILVGGTAYDITPSRKAASFTDKITAVQTGLPDVIVNDTAHGAIVGDFFVFDSVFSAVDGITTDQFEAELGGYKVYQVDDDDNFRVKITGAVATAPSGPGGGLTAGHYQATSGTDATTTGQGYGVGNYGGDDFNPTVYTFNGPSSLTASAAPSVLAFNTNTAYTFALGDHIYPIGYAGFAGDLNSDYLNDKWWVVNFLYGGPDAGADLGYNIATGGALPGPAIGTFYAYNAITDSVEGATRGWGDASEVSIVTGTTRTISISNLGEDLMFANRGGPIYYFDTSAGTGQGIPVALAYGVDLQTISGNVSPPSIVDHFIVPEGHGHTIGFGCNDIGSTVQNRMLIRWSARHNPFDWTPSPSNEAGGEVLRHGSLIMQAVATKDEIVILTDSAAYSMRYVGYPEIYGVKRVGSNVSAISNNCAVAAGSEVYWMGSGQFYMYNGIVQVMPKNVTSYVFDDINNDQLNKIFASTNTAFSEVTWFYPSTDSFENDRYVTYNTTNQAWSFGLMDMLTVNAADDINPSVESTQKYNRTAWQDATVFANPIACYPYSIVNDAIPKVSLSSIFTHEKGTAAGGTRDIDYRIESGEVDILDGERYTYFDKIIPDIQTFNVTDVNSGSVTMSIQGRDLPGRDINSQGDSSVIALATPDDTTGLNYTPDHNATSIRGRARSISVKVSSMASGFGWRLGEIRLRFRPDGRE